MSRRQPWEVLLLLEITEHSKRTQTKQGLERVATGGATHKISSLPEANTAKGSGVWNR
uniref:Uncharacterized protein n=1 Tax=Anguilla anguilla TaxID=7936 RepID=A0A0E9Q220_ANGAN